MTTFNTSPSKPVTGSQIQQSQKIAEPHLKPQLETADFDKADLKKTGIEINRKNMVADPKTYIYNPEIYSGFSHPLVEKAYQSLMIAVSYLNETQQAEIIDACHFADVAHIRDTRKSGEPYITHPIAVAEIIAGFRLDRDTIVAAILHDTVEDTDVTLEQVIERYGKKVSQLVDGVTKLKSNKHNKQQNKAATFHKILTSSLEDPKVLIIKLSDRLHNMSTLDAVRKEKQQSTAKETLDFYIPLARVMGMNDIADHIEVLCYRNLDNEMYGKMHDKLLQHGLGRKLRQDSIHDYLQKIINKKAPQGHVKTIDNKVAMYRQFFRNRGMMDSLIRQYAFEMVLDTIPTCKTIANFLISKYNIPNSQISDNIRHPLPGGNQSLTITYKHQNDTIHITILTKEMQRTARLGVLGVIDAKDSSEVSQSVIQASLRNMKGLLSHGYGNADLDTDNTDNDKNLNSDALNFDEAESTIEELLGYLHEHKIICYSPQGKAYELPRGATALDFAYAVGPFIGHIATSAVVNGIGVDLATVVTNGQTVEVITDKNATPCAEWLGFVGTAKARHLISQWLKKLPQKDKLEQGRQALARAMQTYDKKLEDLTDTDWHDLLSWRELDDKDEFFEQISDSNLLPQLVVARLFSEEINDHLHDPDNPNNTLGKPENLLATLPGVEISFPKCCNPVFGDRIIGYNSKTHGLVVHRHKCYQIQEIRDRFPQRVFNIEWRNDDTVNQHQAGEQVHFPAYLDLNMLITDEQLSEAVACLKQINIGLQKVDTLTSTTILHIIVRSRSHCNEGIHKLRNVLGFTSIKRMYQLGNHS